MPTLTLDPHKVACTFEGHYAWGYNVTMSQWGNSLTLWISELGICILWFLSAQAFSTNYLKAIQGTAGIDILINLGN